MVRRTLALCATLMGCTNDPCQVRHREGCREETHLTPIPIIVGKITTITFVPVRRTVCRVDVCLSYTKR